MNIYGKNKDAVFGVTNPHPMVGFPPGKVRIKMRAGEFAKVYIRNEGGIRCFIPELIHGKWLPAFEIGRNAKEMVCHASKSYKAHKPGNQDCWCLEERKGTCWGQVEVVDSFGPECWTYACQGHLATHENADNYTPEVTIT